MMVLICGSESYDRPKLLATKLERLTMYMKDVRVLCASGTTVGRMAMLWGLDTWKIVDCYHLNKNKSDRPKLERRKEMIADADCLVAVWDCEDEDTADLIRRAREKGIPTFIITFDPDEQ